MILEWGCNLEIELESPQEMMLWLIILLFVLYGHMYLGGLGEKVYSPVFAFQEGFCHPLDVLKKSL